MPIGSFRLVDTSTLLLVAATLLVIPGTRAVGQRPSASDTVLIARTAAPIAIDGRVDEAAWEHASVFPLTMFQPTPGATPSERSEVRILFDDKYLYASARLLVADPTTLRPGSFARDQLGGEDHFMLVLDSSNDDQTGLVFSINPAGGLTDYAIGGDGQSISSAWNGYWDGASRIDGAGWR